MKFSILDCSSNKLDSGDMVRFFSESKFWSSASVGRVDVVDVDEIDTLSGIESLGMYRLFNYNQREKLLIYIKHLFSICLQT